MPAPDELPREETDGTNTGTLRDLEKHAKQVEVAKQAGLLIIIYWVTICIISPGIFYFIGFDLRILFGLFFVLPLIFVLFVLSLIMAINPLIIKKFSVDSRMIMKSKTKESRPATAAQNVIEGRGLSPATSGRGSAQSVSPGN